MLNRRNIVGYWSVVLGNWRKITGYWRITILLTASHCWQLEKHYRTIEKRERLLGNYSRRPKFYNHCAFLPLGKVSFIM
jgi:hypothetical protein